jgi:hypothetical protein
MQDIEYLAPPFVTPHPSMFQSDPAEFIDFSQKIEIKNQLPKLES